MRLGFAPAAAPLIAASGPAAPFVAAGFALAAPVYSAVKDWVTKDECKVSYDANRQQFWDYMGGLLSGDPVTSWDVWKKQGTLTLQRGSWIIQQMTAGLDQFRQYSADAKYSCDADWIQERFSEWDVFWSGVIENLRRELAQMYPNSYRQESAGAMQYAYSAINRLTDPIAGQSYFPQAGTLPPVNTLAPPYQTRAAVQPAGDNGLLFGALALGAGLLLFGRGR